MNKTVQNEGNEILQENINKNISDKVHPNSINKYENIEEVETDVDLYEPEQFNLVE